MYRFFYQEWAFLQLLISLAKGLYLALVYIKANGFSFQHKILPIPVLKINIDFIILKQRNCSFWNRKEDLGMYQFQYVGVYN